MKGATVAPIIIVSLVMPTLPFLMGPFAAIGRAEAQEDLSQQLLRAVAERNTGKVKALLKQGADINAPASPNKEQRTPTLSETWTPLHLALMMGNETMAQLLVESG